MARLRLAKLFLLALFALPLAPAAHGGGRSIFCCDDANKRPVCGDVLPAVCYGRAYREISPQGSVRRHFPAPLTREEIAQRDAEEKRRKDEEERRLKQRRLDQALLDTYTGLEDIDERQERAIAEVERSLGSLRAREAELRARRQRLEEEAGGYRGRELPRALAASVRDVEAELASLQKVIEAKGRDMEAIRARFAADRRRYAELVAAGEDRR